MDIKQFFRKGENLVGMGILLLLAVYMVWLMVGDVSRMQEATTKYDYYQNFIYLIDNIARTYFCCIFLLMVYLTYMNKQYSKWIVRLFYVLGVSSLLYFAIAGQVFDYVFHHVEADYAEKLPSLARTAFTGPAYWIILGYFFIPRILKDARKLQEEQELTV